MTTPRSGGSFGPLDQGGTLALRPDLRPIQTVVRNALGQFTNMQTEARRAHEEMALKAAETISDYLAAKVRANGRTQRPKGRENSLIELLKDPRNRDANAVGWVVGRAGFLESSAAAPYFRNLETGTRIFVGRELRGFFLSASGKASPPSSERIKRDPRLIQTGPFFARTKESKDQLKAQAKRGDFRPDLQTYGRTKRRLPPPKTDAAGKVGGFRILIQNPIPAYQYFFFGGERYLNSGHIARTYQKHLPGLTIG